MSRRRPSIETRVKQSLPHGARVLVAVSGGRDSCVLLHALIHVRRLLSLHCEVCHVDHGLRSSSADDAAHVVSLCAELDVPCHVVKLGKRPTKVNMEAWARTERYRAFARVMKERELSVLVTAHTANDVAETLLMRLLANKELNSIDAVDERRRCIRPLLSSSRQQIDDYVSRHRIRYVDDPSNDDTALVRNRVRHKLLPLLAHEFDPSIVWNLADRAVSIDRDCEALQLLARDEVRRLGAFVERDRGWVGGVRDALQRLPYALQWRIVERILEPLLGFALGERRASAVTALFLEHVPSVQLDRSLTLHRARGGGVELRRRD